MADEEKKTEGEEAKSSSRLTKILAGAAGSIGIPLIVAVLSKWLDPAYLMPKTQPAPHTAPAQPVAPDKSASAQDKTTSPNVASERSVNFITPNLGEHFYSYGWSNAANDFAKDANVDPNLFRYIEALPDGSLHPSIHVSPVEKLGFLSTKQEFDNFSLHIWWRWGVETKATRANVGRRAGILLHITGPDGVVAGALPQSLNVHLREGYAGNIRLLGPENLISCQTRVKRITGQIAPIYDPDTPETTLASTGNVTGTTKWDGTILSRDYDPKAPEDKPKGPNNPSVWNRLRIDSDRGRITVYVNNKVTNEITGCNQNKGRIGFTSNTAEWYIGKIELVPLSAPMSIAQARAVQPKQAKASAAPAPSAPPHSTQASLSKPSNLHTNAAAAKSEAKRNETFGQGKANAKIDLASKLPTPTPFSSVVRAHFKNWDSDGDGKLTSAEIHTAMTRPRFKGDVAAAIATLRCYERYAYSRNDKEMPPFTVADLTRYEAADRNTRIEKFGARGEDLDGYFKEFKRRLKETPRQLFPPNEKPKLSAVKQGYLGDCFFVSMVGALVYMHPNKVRTMIKEVDGIKYTVTFPGLPAPITVLAPTDAEIALNSTAEKNGLWLSVLEKAYAKRENLKTPKAQREKSMTDAIAEGGYASDAVSALTGHGCVDALPRNPNFPDILKAAVDARRLIMTTVRPKRDVPELYSGHVYAVIGYDANTKRVTVFDPDGSNFTPKGKAGVRNGYPIKDGVFTLPIEEFKLVFTGITYEDANTPAGDKKKKAKN